MKRSLAAVLLACSLLFAGGAARASDADFTLVNKTGYDIKAAYVSSTDDKSWGSNILKDTLGDGDSVDITFGHGKACRFDIKVTYKDDDSTAT